MEQHAHMGQHSHGASLEALDTRRGLWATKVTLGALLATAAIQAIVAWVSGSAALLADTLHGVANAATTLPLWIAFSLSRRQAPPQFPYGYHRVEDLAGLVILGFIAVSAALVGYSSVQKLIEGQEPHHLPWALGIGALGFLVNEAIAQYRLKVGREIGSAALIADGQHARVDGLGSLAVVLGLAFVALGFPIGDPAAGLAITALILFLLVHEAGPAVLARVMDRVELSVLQQLQDIAHQVPGVLGVHGVRARWLGHVLIAEMSIEVDSTQTVAQGHQIADEVEHRLTHRVPRLRWCTIHVEPFQERE